MTLYDVIAVVEDETGHKVAGHTRLDSLGMDSLDYLSLLVRCGNVPDEVVPRIETVADLYLASEGKL